MLVFTVYLLRLLDDFLRAFLLFLAAFFFPLLLFLADFLLLFPPWTGPTPFNKPVASTNGFIFSELYINNTKKLERTFFKPLKN